MGVDAVGVPAAPSQTLAGRFARDGYVVLRHFLSGAELDGVRIDVEAHVGAPHHPSCVRPHNTLLPLVWSDRIVDRLLGSVARMDAVRAATGADDLRWISGYISIKEAHSEPLWWHQDWWCWDHPVSFRPAPGQIAVLCYLSDTDVQSGALRVLPGSHLRSSPVHAFLPEAHMPGAVLPASHPAVRDHAEQLTLAVAAGDAVAIDYRLLHGTHANRSGARRDCVLLSFTPSWRDLPEELRAHLISHPAQPRAGEMPTPEATAALLPSFDGRRRDLRLNRIPPADFAIK